MMIWTAVIIAAVLAVLGLIFAVKRHSRTKQDTSELTYSAWKEKVRSKLKEE
ncbi:MAG: hypothetical protein IJU07_10270 [Synergistaceae bacterium]|nr:hypothetical protein [Synergistaceae bacterium]